MNNDAITAINKALEKGQAVVARTCPDEPMHWYDFGGGNLIVPLPSSSFADKSVPYIAALCFLKDGIFYVHAIAIGIERDDLAILEAVRPTAEAEFRKDCLERGIEAPPFVENSK